MAIAADGDSRSLLAVCVKAAPALQLTAADAADIIDEVVSTIRIGWHDAADTARLTRAERNALWGTSVLNPAIHWPAD